MRATIGRVAVVMLLSIGVSGCTSGPTWSSLAWWRKKPDATAVAGGEAPKFNPANPLLPSASQNPNNSLAGTQRPGAMAAASMAAAGNPAAPAGTTGYSASPAAYQNTAYPTTPYQPVKLAPAAGASASAGAAPGNPWASNATNPAANAWTGGTPAVGSTANSAMPGRYAPGASAATAGYPTATGGATPQQNYVPGSPSSTMAAAPGAQPQAGFYNPTYDGGGSATRYASGAAIPRTAANSNMSAAAAPQMPSSSMPNISAPAGSMPNYRTADTRSSMANSVAPTASTDAASVNPNNTTVGDRYSGFNGAPASATMAPAAVGAAPAADRYAPPAIGATGAFIAGDRYAQPTGGIQPAANVADQGSTGYPSATTASPVGNTGYNPADASSAAAMSGTTGGLPARNNSEYRPGGTSNYSSPAGSPVQPSSDNAPPDTRSQNGGAPGGGYQSSNNVTGRSSSGVVLASATLPAGGDVYGAYQGGVSQSTGNPKSFGASSSEPAYGAPNPVAATPALLPANSGW
ncbi:MAG TPA: hypothetical protein VGJ04_05185 [Pirellulales bacterium]